MARIWEGRMRSAMRQNERQDERGAEGQRLLFQAAMAQECELGTLGHGPTGSGG